MSLSFFTLRIANQRRDIEWDADRKIDLEFRKDEFIGEIGELFNALKKRRREQLGLKGSRVDAQDIIDEFADVAITLDLLAMELDIDLGEAIISKFNRTSTKHGFKTKL